LVGEWLQADFLDAHDCDEGDALGQTKGILRGKGELKSKRKIAIELQLGIFIWAVEGDKRGALR
jgi:hypothetical protein